MYRYDYPHPAVTTDIVVFTRGDAGPKVLLIRRASPPFEGCWALPGGFVQPDETLDEGARRELQEETGLAGVQLKQLYAFGDPGRDPRERVITVAYYALVSSDRIEPQAGTDADDAGWFGIDNLPALAFDHDRIIAMAQERLRSAFD